MTRAPDLQQLSSSLWRLPLPSPTLPPFDHTNTFIIADGGVAAIVDPGFEDAGSLAQLRNAVASLGVRLVKAVLLTHTHNDHVAGLSATVAAFDGPSVYVHPFELPRLENQRTEPRALSDGRVLTIGGTVVEALHTPGHSPGHIAYHLSEEGAVLCGDLVAGSGSVWVGVPEGDVSDYLASLERLQALPGLKALGPGHGEPPVDPYARLRESHAHRLDREQMVLDALETERSLTELREQVYPALDPAMHGASEASLLAHLRKLMSEMRVVHLGDDEQGPFVIRR